MKILVHVHGYPPDHNAGAEWMLHHMLKWLQKKGHEILVATQTLKEYEFEGIKVVNETGSTHIRGHYRWCDIVISHLVRHGKVINNIRVVDKVALFLMHNTHSYENIKMIAHWSCLAFNSEYTRSQPGYDHKDSVIVYPPCPVKYYGTNRGGAKFVTLINHCKQKGSDVFHALAKDLPNVDFMAVKGDYFHQEKKKGLENVTYKPNTPEIPKMYALTKVLLMPSEYESFGRTAIEAACSGIPTIAAPTEGLKESLGEAGIFIDLKDREAWAKEIKKLIGDKEYYKSRSDLAKARAKELEEMFEPQMEALAELMDKAINRKIKNLRQ